MVDHGSHEKRQQPDWAIIWWTERGWVAALQVELLIAGALGLVWLARWVFA